MVPTSLHMRVQILKLQLPGIESSSDRNSVCPLRDLGMQPQVCFGPSGSHYMPLADPLFTGDPQILSFQQRELKQPPRIPHLPIY